MGPGISALAHRTELNRRVSGILQFTTIQNMGGIRYSHGALQERIPAVSQSAYGGLLINAASPIFHPLKGIIDL
jgi:hypothetical protein